MMKLEQKSRFEPKLASKHKFEPKLKQLKSKMQISTPSLLEISNLESTALIQKLNNCRFENWKNENKM